MGYKNRAARWWLFGACAVGVCAGAVISADAVAAKIRKKAPRHHLPRGLDSLPPDSSEDVLDAGVAPSPAPQVPAAADALESTTGDQVVSKGLHCLYGNEQNADGGMRCLSPEELDPPLHIIVDTSWMAERLGLLSKVAVPVPPLGTSADAGVDAGDDSPYKVRVARLSFENGVVGGVRRRFKDERDRLQLCVERGGGLPTGSARLKLLFFVRKDRRASGLIVASARNIPRSVVRCVTKVVREQKFGRPSRSPVGVKLLFELKERDD